MKPIYYLPAILFMLCLFSCKKEDDNPAPNEPSVQAKLTGTWQCKKVHQAYHDASNPVTETLRVYEAGGPILNFGTQGTLEEGYFYKGNFQADASGTYQLNGQNLTFSIDNARVLYSGTPYIDTLTANHLSLIDTVFYSSNNQIYTILSIDAAR